MQLLNAQTDAVMASAIEIADTRAARRKGLLGRDHLDPAAALVLTPCFGVHTAFMRFPIDVVFVDRRGVVLRVVRQLAPWRLAAAWGARAVIELAGGAIRGARDVRVGDRFYLACAPDDDGDAPAPALASLPAAIPSLRRMASKPACSGS